MYLFIYVSQAQPYVYVYVYWVYPCISMYPLITGDQIQSIEYSMFIIAEPPRKAHGSLNVNMLNFNNLTRCLTLAVLTLTVGVVCKYKYETKLFKVPLDHFGYQRNETFNIRYLVNEEHWDQGGGPIFFYTGNEVSVKVSF